MSQERVDNDEFLSRLTTLLSSTHSATHGSVYLTQKPLGAESSETPSQQILIRATNGLSKPHRTTTTTKSKSADPKKQPKIKLATVVDMTDGDTFCSRYGELGKRGMEELRKRDKKKAKEKAKAKKKGKA